MKIMNSESRFLKPTPIEYEEFFREAAGTENVGPLLRTLVQMIRPKRILEIGAGYTTPFLLEAIVNNNRVFDDGNLSESYFRNYEYQPKFVIIENMSQTDLGDLSKNPSMNEIIDSEYVDFIEGNFEDKFEELFEKYSFFDFVWFDCGGPEQYKVFMDKYWGICSNYILFHFTYFDGEPNANLDIILDNITDNPMRFDIIEPHKIRQGSVTMIRKAFKTL